MAWAIASEKILTKTKDIITKIPNFVISIIYVALFIMVLRLINLIPKGRRSTRTSGKKNQFLTAYEENMYNMQRRKYRKRKKFY